VTARSPPASAQPSFFAFAYAGRLPGWAWGVSDRGVVFTVNGLFVLPHTPPGLGINFVARDVLDATDVNDALRRLRRTGQDGGSHFNLGSAVAPRRQLSVETGNGPTTVLDVGNMGGGHYAHFNAYLHRDGLAGFGDFVSSVYRQARAATLRARQLPTLTGPTASVEASILEVMGDRGGDRGVYCINRCNSTTDSDYITYVTVRVRVFTDRTSAASTPWLDVNMSAPMPSSLPGFPY
jgi:hypothetical protein